MAEPLTFTPYPDGFAVVIARRGAPIGVLVRDRSVWLSYIGDTLLTANEHRQIADWMGHRDPAA